jgi:Conjugal transfer protein TraD
VCCEEIQVMDDKYAQKLQKQEEKIEKLRAMIEKQELHRQQLLKRIKSQQRKEQNRRKFEIGGLALIADLEFADRGALLGYLLEAKKAFGDDYRFKTLKAVGDRVLMDRATQRIQKQKSKKGQGDQLKEQQNATAATMVKTA